MFIPARVIFFLALTAWGTAAFELSFSGFPLHFSAADLQNIEPFSDAATASERTAGNITFFGLAAGFVLFGFLSDRFGRCRILLLCLFLAPLCSGLGCISFSFSDFLILRFITGAASGGLFLTGTLLLYEQRDAMFRRNAPQFVPMLTLIMMMWFVLLPLIPVIHWRLSVAATFLPVFFLLYFYRYYDEPPRWKIAVRDKRFANRTAKKYGNIRERRKIVRGTFTLFAVIVILKIPFTDYFFPSLQSRESRIMIIAQQDGILAYLIQEPQLLNTEELGQLDWQAIGEKLTAQRDIPRALFDALLTLNAEKRTISRQNLLDRAVAAWDKHKGNRRKATEIPQNE
ncbi:MAG: MFS transporter, partial [Planctomycetaceae bacterium]|nr:MFS transporter [Planctomycetaceae bacterium]